MRLMCQKIREKQPSQESDLLIKFLAYGNVKYNLLKSEQQVAEFCTLNTKELL